MTDQPPQEVFAAIEDGQRLRGWIANGYAQVEYLLGDVLTRSLQFAEYAEVAGRLPHRIEKRIARVRQILDLDGYFAQHRDELNWIIEAFEAHFPF